MLILALSFHVPLYPPRPSTPVSYHVLATWRWSCRKMFIGGLNWDTTDGTCPATPYLLVCSSTKSTVAESLKKYFTQFGKVEACTIMRDPAGRSRCFAFLTFEDPASVNAVMVREHFLDGKIVRGPVVHIDLMITHLFPHRSTRSAQYHGRSTSAPPSCSSAVSQAVSHQSQCVISSRNSAKSSTRPSCLTAKRGEARVSASFRLRMSTLSLC